MATSPRAGKFSDSVTVEWSDGTDFTGYAYVALVPPTYGVDDDATSLEIRNFSAAPVEVPDRIPIKIQEGKYIGSAALWYNADLTPPNSRYKMCLFDTTKRQVTSFSDYFTVSTDPFTPPTLTPTVPSVGTNVPQPD